MQLGQTVFYRLTLKDANQVNKRRQDGKNFFSSCLSKSAKAGTDPNMWKTLSTLVVSGFQLHVGDKVREDSLLPAVITDLGYKDPRRSEVVAGLRVLLPGNDVLWLSEVQEAYDVTDDRESGFLPLPGHFVQAAPLEAEV